MHVIRIQLPQLHQLLHLRNHILRRRRHHRIKIPRRLSIYQIPPPITLPSLHKRKIPANPPLQHILPPIELPRLFPLRHNRPNARRRIKPRNPRPARSYPLCKRPLWIQLQLQLPRRDKLFEQLVLPHIRRNHLLHLPVLQQQPNPKIIHPGIITNNRQILRPPPPHRRNQILRYPTKPKPTHQNGRPIAEPINPHIRRRNPLIHAISAVPLSLCAFALRLRSTPSLYAFALWVAVSTATFTRPVQWALARERTPPTCSN